MLILVSGTVFAAKGQTSKGYVSILMSVLSDLGFIDYLDELADSAEEPEYLDVYLMTGGGLKIDDDGNKIDHNLWNKEDDGSWTYPSIVEALTNAGYKEGQVSLEDSELPHTYQLWTYSAGKNGKGELKLIDKLTNFAGDDKALAYLLDYAYDKTKDSGCRYILHLDGHGGGPAYGVFINMASQNPDDMPMTPFETLTKTVMESKLIKSGKKFEVTILDMCLMQSIEELKNVSGFSKSFIASEKSTVGTDLYNFYELLSKEPEADSRKIGQALVDGTGDYFIDSDNRGYTWSAIETTPEKVDRILEAFDKFAEGVLEASKEMGSFDIFLEALWESEDFGNDHEDSAYDILSVAKLYDQSSKTSYARDIRKALDAAMIAEDHGPDMGEACGLAFYFNTDWSQESITTDNDYNRYMRTLESCLPKYAEMIKLYVEL